MSWQSYVDDQLISTKVIKNAVIAGHDGNIWAHSAGFPVSEAGTGAQYCNKDKRHEAAAQLPELQFVSRGGNYEPGPGLSRTEETGQYLVD